MLHQQIFKQKNVIFRKVQDHDYSHYPDITISQQHRENSRRANLYISMIPWRILKGWSVTY